MNKQPKSRSAFTLIEMLVVIVIMSLLAMALVSALKSAKRQAQAAHCQARLKNLHQACMNFLADNGSYPYAGSHEYYDSLTETYSERKGWVAWVRDDGKTDAAGKPFNPWAEDNTISHAKEYLHAGMFDYPDSKSFEGQIASRSIKEGSIFKYATRDISTYACDTAANDFKRRYTKPQVVVKRSYAMNSWFGSRRNVIDRRQLIDFRNKEPSRMGYIIEIQQSGDHGKEHIGESATDAPSNVSIPDDSVWEHANGERYGLYHVKSGNRHGHVIFVDGHIESLTDQLNKHGDDYTTQNTKIGDATH